MGGRALDPMDRVLELAAQAREAGRGVCEWMLLEILACALQRLENLPLTSQHGVLLRKWWRAVRMSGRCAREWWMRCRVGAACIPCVGDGPAGRRASASCCGGVVIRPWWIGHPATWTGDPTEMER